MFININKISSDFDGRVICCQIDEGPDSEEITLCNIYAPNKDSPWFFDALEQRMYDYTEHKVIVGDFNLALNPQIDRYGDKNSSNNSKSCAKLKSVMEDLYLTDVWRDRNPEKLRFSWSKRNPRLQASRLDYAIVSRGIDVMTDNCTYLQSILTDHSAFYLSISTNRNKRGPGYWKLNTNLLYEESHLAEIRDAIAQSIKRSSGSTSSQVWLSIKGSIAKKCKEIGCV